MPDPDFAADGIARYRDVAKWIVGAVAGVAVVLAAGLQLTSIGSLEGADLKWAIGSVVVVIVSAGWIVWWALKVFEPLEMRMSAVNADVFSKLKKAGLVPFDVASGAEVSERFREVLDNPLNGATVKAAWRKKAGTFTDRAALYTIRRIYDRSMKAILLWAAVGALGIVVFAFVAHEDDPPAGGALPPKPSAAIVTLTGEGREVYGKALGSDCAKEPFHAISIGGSEESPSLISVPTDKCKAIRMNLPTDLGRATSKLAAPISATDG